MNTKPRSDAVLFKLSLEDQEKLNHWLLTNRSYAEVRRLLAAPAPEGMNLKVHENTLIRYYERVIPGHIEARRKNAVATSRHLKKAIETDPNEFDATALDSLKQRVFELTLSPESDTDAIYKLYRLVLRAKDQELARDKFEYNASKAIMKNFDKIAKIMRQKDKHTDRATLNRLRLEVFGTLTDQEEPLTGDEWTQARVEDESQNLAEPHETNGTIAGEESPNPENIPSGNLRKSVRIPVPALQDVDQSSLSSESSDSSSFPPFASVKEQPSPSVPTCDDTIGDAIIMGPEKPSHPAGSYSDSLSDAVLEETPFSVDDTRLYKVKSGTDYFGGYFQWEYCDGHNPHGADTKYFFDQMSGTFLRRREQ